MGSISDFASNPFVNEIGFVTGSATIAGNTYSHSLQYPIVDTNLVIDIYSDAVGIFRIQNIKAERAFS